MNVVQDGKTLRVNKTADYKRENFEFTGKCGTRIGVRASDSMKFDLTGCLAAPSTPSLATRVGR
jgi:hypothetical protein